jgi:hypothetical protein
MQIDDTDGRQAWEMPLGEVRGMRNFPKGLFNLIRLFLSFAALPQGGKRSLGLVELSLSPLEQGLTALELAAIRGYFQDAFRKGGMFQGKAGKAGPPKNTGIMRLGRLGINAIADSIPKGKG